VGGSRTIGVCQRKASCRMFPRLERLNALDRRARGAFPTLRSWSGEGSSICARWPGRLRLVWLRECTPCRWPDRWFPAVNRLHCGNHCFRDQPNRTFGYRPLGRTTRGLTPVSVGQPASRRLARRGDDFGRRGHVGDIHSIQAGHSERRLLAGRVRPCVQFQARASRLGAARGGAIQASLTGAPPSTNDSLPPLDRPGVGPRDVTSSPKSTTGESWKTA
jgi:hypothetical protein